MIAVAIILFWLGLCLGSFLNAMVWRIRKKMDWVKGRSQCDNCSHQLSALDLIPVLSWLFLGGKCRYCHKSVSWQHPAVELATGLVFMLSYLLWPGGLHSHGDYVLLVTWLVGSVGLMSLLVYDFHWMLLPNKILYPTFFLVALGRLIYLIGYEPHKVHALLHWLLSIAVASGIFFIIYYVSSGKWIGFGDVRLGLISGTLLASPSKSFLMIFVASVLGSLFTVPMMMKGRKTMNSQIPFGPFLIASTALVLLFGDTWINWYTSHLI